MCPRDEGGVLGVGTLAALSSDKKALSGRGWAVLCPELGNPEGRGRLYTQLNLNPAPCASERPLGMDQKEDSLEGQEQRAFELPDLTVL